MKSKKAAQPTDIFAAADRDLFASVTCVTRIEVQNNRLKLYLEKKPERTPPLWLQKIACFVSDPAQSYEATAIIVGIVEKDGETYLLSRAIQGVPFAEATARRLTKEATLVLRSPFGRKHTLDFHTLFRAEKKTATQQT